MSGGNIDKLTMSGGNINPLTLSPSARLLAGLSKSLPRACRGGEWLDIEGI